MLSEKLPQLAKRVKKLVDMEIICPTKALIPYSVRGRVLSEHLEAGSGPVTQLKSLPRSLILIFYKLLIT